MKRKNITDLLLTWECAHCGAINVMGDTVCCVCGLDKLIAIVENGLKKKNGVFEELGKPPLPKSRSIIAYTIAHNQTSNFAMNLLERKIINLFIGYKVESEFYFRNWDRFKLRVRQIIQPVYFGILKSELGGSNRKFETFVNRVVTKIDKYYDTQ